MGKRGPHPIPSAAQRLRGTYRPDRRRGEPVPEAGSVARPKWLVGRAGRLWKQVVDPAEGLGLATSADAVALALLVQSLDDYFVARGIVEKAGIVIVTDKGNEIQHPAVGAMNKAWERVVKMLREFGLTPASRAGLHIGQAEKATDKARFFKVVG